LSVASLQGINRITFVLFPRLSVLLPPPFACFCSFRTSVYHNSNYRRYTYGRATAVHLLLLQIHLVSSLMGRLVYVDNRGCNFPGRRWCSPCSLLDCLIFHTCFPLPCLILAIFLCRFRNLISFFPNRIQSMDIGAAFGVTGAMVVVEFAMRVTVAYRDRFFLWMLRYKPYDHYALSPFCVSDGTVFGFSLEQGGNCCASETPSCDASPSRPDDARNGCRELGYDYS